MRPSVLSPARLGPLKPISLATELSTRAQVDFRQFYHIFPRKHKPSITRNPSTWGSVSSVIHASRSVSYEQRAKDLNQQGVDEALSEFDTAVADDQEKQQRAPWHRQGVDVAPVRRQRSAGAMTKGER
ncbi:hypothetical protein A1O7_04263 [Cladophialophora yegresii CBS 114405]|uniref:Uncharacterized protein n=1 Tax=Cladophialophora yegresii CBS 114405 TaxID=1182544 RepID=W9W6F9_9EURO|nr:uncharacterized protein A1O7_04263 [Cladophialophora yegresii CBS 114405]EXJ60111.1 hypothetical protein A1O7_04263 [Cladophialophora yegresii CBS 114405]